MRWGGVLVGMGTRMVVFAVKRVGRNGRNGYVVHRGTG